MIQPDRVADDVGRKTLALVDIHARSIRLHQLTCQCPGISGTFTLAWSMTNASSPRAISARYFRLRARNIECHPVDVIGTVPFQMSQSPSSFSGFVAAVASMIATRPQTRAAAMAR